MLKTAYSTVRSMKNVAVLTEDGAFALFFRPHPGGFDSSRVPTPGNLPSKAKKMLMPGGQPGRGGGGLGAGGIDWCLTFIMLNVGMEDNLEFWSRQFLNSEVQNTYVFHSRVSRRHSRVITFFHINRSLCLFSFPGQNNCISLTDIHVQHLASLCRKHQMREVNTKQHKKKQTRKITKFELLFILVMMTGSFILVL